MERLDESEFHKSKEAQWDATPYGSWFTSESGEISDILEKRALAHALGASRYGHALDFGIGNGRLLEVYGSHCDRVTGMDISEVQLAEAAKQATALNVPFESRLSRGDADLEESEPDQYDLILCSRVIQHLKDWRATIRSFAHVLKPEGRLVLVAYNRTSLYGLKKLYEMKFVDPSKGHFHTRSQIQRALRVHGLEIEYHRGALMGQPELLKGRHVPRLVRRMMLGVEPLAGFPLVKNFGQFHVVRARPAQRESARSPSCQSKVEMSDSPHSAEPC
jgi:SAM-dependent methyltransferase